MRHARSTILISVLVVAAASGCTNTTSTTTFKFDEPLVITGEPLPNGGSAMVYTSEETPEQNLAVRARQFFSNACDWSGEPNCPIKGEQLVRLEFSVGAPQKDLILTDRSYKIGQFEGYEVEVVSIDSANKRATIVIRHQATPLDVSPASINLGDIPCDFNFSLRVCSPGCSAKTYTFTVTNRGTNSTQFYILPGTVVGSAWSDDACVGQSNVCSLAPLQNKTINGTLNLCGSGFRKGVIKDKMLVVESPSKASKEVKINVVVV